MHSIQIQITDTRIHKVFGGIEDIKYEISIKYDVNPQDDLLHMQVRQLEESLSVYESYLHKSKAFKHEAEKRILIDDVRCAQMLNLSSMGANWKTYESMQGLTDYEILKGIEQRLSQYLGNFKADKIPDNYYVDIKGLRKYISGVKGNPFAENW